MRLVPKNWTEFQHYKDRKPAWIKLHRELLDDFEYATLPLISRAFAPMLWLLASENDGGQFDGSPKNLAFRLRCTEKEAIAALAPLLEAGFFIEASDGELSLEKWPSRYVSDAIRSDVMEACESKCVSCGSPESLEIDHIVPVSKGGESVRENLQVLCRSCNRSKRAKSAEQFATQIKSPRSLEKEKEKERERQVKTEKDIRAEFEKFKEAYPKRKGSQGWSEAEKLFQVACEQHSPDALISAAKKYRDSIKPDTLGTEFVPMAVKFLRRKLYIEFIPTQEEIERAKKAEEFLASRGFGVIQGGKNET